MLSSFWSGLGGELAKQWIARVLTPAFVFWAAGLLAVWADTHRGDVAKHGWLRLSRQLRDHSNQCQLSVKAHSFSCR